MSSRQVDLRVDWCSHAAAKYAVEHWHYSQKMPAGKLIKLGVWEAGAFVGCVLFGRGANNNIGSRYGMSQTGVCELVRVALKGHWKPVSMIVMSAIKNLKRQSHGLRLVVSYADPAQGHIGTIYQASNWLYVGSSNEQRELLVAGQYMHKRAASAKWGTASPGRIRELTGLDVIYGPREWKHTYLHPLDRAMRRQILPLSQPYPKRETCGQSVNGDTSGVQPGKPGSIPGVRLETGPSTRRDPVLVQG